MDVLIHLVMKLFLDLSLKCTPLCLQDAILAKNCANLDWWATHADQELKSKLLRVIQWMYSANLRVLGRW